MRLKLPFRFVLRISRDNGKEQTERRVVHGLAGLFRYASKVDVFLMLGGTLCAMVVGSAGPMLGLIFGSMTNAFTRATIYGFSEDSDHNFHRYNVSFPTVHALRKSSPEEALRYGKTKRDLEISFLFINGWPAIGSIVAGVLSDCYLGPYVLALASIWVNFLAAFLFYAEEIIKARIQINPYSDTFSNIASLAFIFIKSTDYARMVLALENLKSKKQSSVTLLLFILILVGGKPKSGGLLVLFTSYLNLSYRGEVRTGFYTIVLSLVLFHFVPRPVSESEFSYIARKVIQSVFITTLKSLKLYRHPMNPLGFRAFDKQTAMITRDILMLFSSILPTIGFFFYLKGEWAEGHLWEAFATQSPPPGLYHYTGLTSGFLIVTYISMIVSFFVLKPLSVLFGLKPKFSHHFVLGYLISLIVCWYSTLLVRVHEPIGFLQGIGHIRILNTREDAVRILTDDINVSKKNFTIQPHGVIMLSFPVSDKLLLRTIFIFNEVDKLSTHLEVALSKCAAYVLIDPPELVRVKGYLPIWSGVPEAYDSLMARFYVFTATRSFVNMKFTLEDLASKKSVKDGFLIPGESSVLEVPPGKYLVSLQKYNVEEKLEVFSGSVSGLIFYADYHSGKLIVDEVTQGQVASSLLITGLAMGWGFSVIFGYISLVYMAFMRAPHGFLTTTFGYLSFQEYLAYWILLIGFHTWHDQVTSHVLMVYSFSLSFLFFLCIFIYMKYTNL